MWTLLKRINTVVGTACTIYTVAKLMFKTFKKYDIKRRERI